jgi:hypothetical protein
MALCSTVVLTSVSLMPSALLWMSLTFHLLLSPLVKMIPHRALMIAEQSVASYLSLWLMAPCTAKPRACTEVNEKDIN